MNTAPDHSQNSPDGRIFRSASGIRSMPRCSILKAAYSCGTSSRVCVLPCLPETLLICHSRVLVDVRCLAHWPTILHVSGKHSVSVM